MLAQQGEKAQGEIAEARACGVYDGFLVNEKLEEAIERAVGMVERERGRRGGRGG